MSSYHFRIEEILCKRFMDVCESKELTAKDISKLLKASFIYLIGQENNPFTLDEIFFLKELLEIEEEDLVIKALFGRGMVREFEKKNISKRDFANRINASISYVNRILIGDFSLSLRDYFRYLKALRRLEEEYEFIESLEKSRKE